MFNLTNKKSELFTVFCLYCFSMELESSLSELEKFVRVIVSSLEESCFVGRRDVSEIFVNDVVELDTSDSLLICKL